MKKLGVAICGLALALSMAFGGCTQTSIKPWDNLGGGGVGTDVTVSGDGNTGDYLLDEGGSSASSDYDTTASDYMVINLTALPTADLTGVSAYTYADGNLNISSGGKYELTGTLNGVVNVSNVAEDISVILSNASVNSIAFASTTANRVLTVKDGTENSVTYADGISDTGALIYIEDTTLTLNGTGALSVDCNSAVKAGVEVKLTENLSTATEHLEINGINLTVINAKKAGVKSTKKVVIKNSDINVTSAGDGIKTDMEPSSESEALLFASDISNGYVYIEKTNLTLNCGDDGVSAENCLYIANTINETVNITTNGGAPATVTETSSDAADGKALKTGGISYTDANNVETDYPASYDANYGLVITGGTFVINSNDDAVSSKGNLVISDGTFNVSSGDDGFHAEYLTKITGGTLTVDKCYEGVEGATVEISGGTINVTSVDDGINAANADLTNYAYYILIEGGNINVDAGGDGIDSNGTVKITGGTVMIDGPTDGANASLDADSGILTNGGTLFAVGSAGMVETPSSNSTQCYISITTSSAQTAGTVITVKNANGETIFTGTAQKKFQSAIISLPSFVQGQTYTVTVGTQNYSTTLNGIGTALGTNAHGGGNQGFMPR